MAPNPANCLVILQVGSRRVSATVAWREDDTERVVAHRKVECDWPNLGDRGRRQVVAEALALAAQSAGVEIYSVFVSISDPSLRGNFASGFVDLGQELPFTEEDRYRALARATHQAIGTEREVLHALPQRWAVRSMAGEREVAQPVGEVGSRLTCHVLLITAERRVSAAMEQILTSCELHTEGVIAPPVALYRGLVSHLPKRGSTLVIDLGARHTHIMVHRKNRLVHVETHPFGGDHLTEAIALDQGLTFAQAEAIKRDLDLTTHAKSTDFEGQTYLWRDVQERHRLLGPAARRCTDMLREFFTSRARDLRELELLAQQGRIHLVGRGAALNGLLGLVKEIFAMDAVLGTNQQDRELSTELADLMTVGLIRQAAIERERALRERGGSGIRQVTTAAGGLLAWLFAPLE